MAPLRKKIAGVRVQYDQVQGQGGAAVGLAEDVGADADVDMLKGEGTSLQDVDSE